MKDERWEVVKKSASPKRPNDISVVLNFCFLVCFG